MGSAVATTALAPLVFYIPPEQMSYPFKMGVATAGKVIKLIHSKLDDLHCYDLFCFVLFCFAMICFDC